MTMWFLLAVAFAHPDPDLRYLECGDFSELATEAVRGVLSPEARACLMSVARDDELPVALRYGAGRIVVRQVARPAEPADSALALVVEMYELSGSREMARIAGHLVDDPEGRELWEQREAMANGGPPEFLPSWGFPEEEPVCFDGSTLDIKPVSPASARAHRRQHRKERRSVLPRHRR